MPCSRAERSEVALPPIGGCASSTSFCSLSESSQCDPARLAERILALCEQLHEARPSFEQLRQLLGRQLPR